MKYILQIYSSIHGVPGQVLGVAVNFSRKPGQAAAGVAMVEFLCLATLRVYALGPERKKKKIKRNHKNARIKRKFAINSRAKDSKRE